MANHLMLFAAVRGSGVATLNEAEDPNAVTVNDAKGFINAIQNGTATTINVAKDLNLAEQTDSKYTEIKIKNKRDIVIQSDNPEEKRTIDFSGYSFDMDTQNSVTFKDLNIYARSYWGLVYNAGGYTFDNVNFTGSQLIYTKPWINSTLTFKNNITANSVSSYVGPLDGKTRDTQQNGGQQILQFKGGTNQIIFDENSNVTLTTEDANALEIDGGTTTIDVKDGANVAINPHSKGDPESRNGIGTGDVARAIAANAKMTINIDPNSTLTINTEKVDGDKDVAGALYLNSDAALNVNGKLVINSNGTPSANKSNGVPVYINGSAKINVGNGGSFSLDATNLGNYSSSLISINGKGSVKLDPHSSFKISGDGTGALTAINLSSGSTFTSDQPDSFTIDLSANTSTGKSLIKNGAINFTRVKAVTDGNESQPLGKIDVTYDRNGNAKSYIITAQDENTVKQVGEGLTNKNLIDLVKAGEDVTLSNLHLSKNNVLTGTVASSGSNNPIYVTVTVGGVSTNVPVLDHYTVYTNTNGIVTSNNIDYAAQTASTGGNFSIDLSKLASSLTDDTQVKVTATKDFVEGAQTESVAALRALNTTTLQELVDAALAEKAKPSYYNATAEAQKAYTDAISTGKTILANQNNYDQVDVDNAVTAIQKAQKALTGEPTNKTELQQAVDQASSVEASDNYTNADSNLQKAYTDAISAGQTVLSNDNATQTEVDNVLTTINNAKDALNGDAKKAASKAALQKAVDEAPTVKSDDAAYYNGSTEAKTAYDDAITAGQTVLDNPAATATQITDALNAINTAKGNLKGEATDKSALQTAVDNSTTVKESNNYTNADADLQKAYTDAISAGQTVLSNDNATQTEVDNALTTINNAKDALNGDAKKAASKEALQKAVDEAPTVKSDDAAYYNGSTEAKTAYDDAITAGQTVLDNPAATATQITDALNAINTAKGNLKGEATDKSALQTAVDNSTTVKESNNYTNADQTQKTAYDKAVTDAQTVLDKTNATQAEVNQALQDLETANNNLNGNAKTEAANKAALEAAVKDAPNVRNTPAYYNGSEEAKKTYNDAINAGQAVLDQANPSASEVKNALNAINAAKDNLKGEATSTEALKTALTNANDAKETGNYTNADQANQEALNNAINAGQDLLKNTNATQAEVDSAAKAITAAINGMNGDTNLAKAKTAATEDIQKALDTKTTQITDANNIDQTTKDQLIADAKKAAEDANTAINQATDPNAVNTAKTEGIANINKVTVPSLEDAKTKAAKEIDQALTDKTKAITDAENIDQTTKDQLIKEATDAANTAKDAIEKSTTNDEATKAGQAGVNAINNVKVPSVTDSQNAAKEVIDNALNSKTKEINAATNIDQTTKDQLIKEATDAANNAKEAIDKASTAEAIKTAQDEGTTKINNVTVPSLEDAKKAATKAVDDALAAQTEVINKANNLSDAEKKDLIDQATAEANKAKENIETATTNNEAAQAAQAGVDAIKKIVPTSLDTVKSDANKAIDDALTKKLEKINSANDLTADEKTALTQEANTVADKAKEEITNATTNDAVIEAQNNGVTAIDDIKVPTESAVKEAAKKAVADAATAKNNAIDASNLTDEEKAALKQKVTDAQNAADQAIDKATTNAAVTEAQTNGVNAINGIEVTTSTAKEAAKKVVAEAATAKNNAIDASNLTAEEKAALKQKVTEAQDSADQAIDKATTDAAVTEAQTNGVNAINGIEVTTSTAKEAAKKVVADAATAKNNAIDASNLTAEEKAALKQKVTEAQKAADQAIDNATTDAAVTEAQTNGVTTIDDIKVPTESAVKEAAKQAVADAATAKNNAIDSSNLTAEEKAALKQKVTDAQTVADQAIDKATTNAAVIEAQTNGVNAIDDIKVPTESAAKQAAKEAVADAATAKNNAIDSSNLTAEEKAALKQKVTDAQTVADQAIDKATTNAAVTEAQTNGVNAINGIKVPTTSATKEQAITDLNTAVDDAKKAIDQDNNLTNEQKQAAKDQINSDAKTAQDAINNAKTNDDVKKAAADGTLAIDKDVANAAIDNAVAGKKAEISNSPLTDEEKTALNNEVAQKANSAREAINNATTPEAVATAQEDGVKNITDTEVPSESAAKQAAKKAVAKAADEKNTAIDSSNLTDEEKAALKQKVTDAQNAADQAIDNAKTNAAVTEAKDKGIKNINDIDVPSKSDAKEKAVTDLNTAVENAKKAIDQDSNLTDEQKQAAKDQIDSDAKTAQEAINNAKTDNDVNNAVNSGKVSIDKDVANAAIDNAVAGKLKEIQDPLTTEEKQAYTDLINSEANNAKQNIANATTVEEVTTAQTNGVNEINNTGIPTTSSAKEKAIAAINDALQTKTDEINNASNINTQEKTDLINQATEAANAAKNNINNATTNTDVDTAQTNGEKAIADVTVPNLSDVKKESIDLINKALDAKTDEINNASNLSQDEKQGLINTATNAATEAINNVNQAQTNDDAKAAATTGVQNIENITIPTLDEAKKNANQAIDDALNSKVNEINNASNLNETEKQKLVDQANEAAATAKNNVEKATTNDDARDAANAGIDNIKGITFTSLEDAKNAANTAIDNALQVKTDEINNASNLSTDEKQDLINQATEVAKNAKDNINNATTNDAVTEAQNKGIADIANVTVPSLDQVKQDAIKQVQDAKNKQISAASNLSAEEQKELTDQVDKIANDAIAKINDAATTTNDAVNATRDDAIKQITDLFIPTLDGAQTDAINAIESAKNAKLNDINNAAHLTDQEKQALVDQTNKAADEATKAIKAAQTNDEVKSAETAGLDNINNITIPTLVQKQQEAIEELNAARDAKNSAIDNAADLTTDEKNALKDKVQVEYSNAVSNITSATTDEAVTTAKEDGITAIKDIQIPTKSPTKEQATSDLTTAVDEAKNAIDQDSNLTDEEKQAAKDQIDSDAQKAQEAIDNAKTADEVKTAVDNGQLAIDKDVANAAIDNAVAGKKAEISKSPLTDEEKTALNNEVDQKAQDAKEAINNATTPEAVTTAQENGIKNITNTEVSTESTAKEAAKKAIAEAAEAKNNAIDSSNLTDEEKAALKQEVTDAQNAADKAIDNATTNAAVTEAEDNGIKAINGIEIPAKSPAKEQATTDLNDAVDDAKKAIDQDSNLTDAEKQAAKDQIDSDAKKAQEAIDNAKTDDEVKTAVDNGQLAIDKDVANAAIDNAVAGKKAEIAKAPLTTDEANALNDLVDQEAKVAKNAIDSATTIPAVEDAKNTGVAAINDIAVPTTSSTKDQANQTIDDALANKIKEINDATNLSDKQKQDLIDQANNAANTAKDNITKATSDSEVATATTDGIDAIANVTVPSLETAKDQAKDLIDDVLNEKKNEINNADNLSDSQKQDLINQATDEADQAKKNIDNATTNNDVQTAEDNGAQAIENVTVPSLDEAKKASTKVIDEVLKEKTAEINAATNLSNAEKDALIKDATTAANTAKDNIAKATTNDAVKDAETDGVKAILDIKVPGREDQQKDAIAALDRALADKVSEIDNANNLSETTKQDLKQQAQAAYTTAVDNVNNAQTSAEINAARDNGIQAILDITVPTLTDAQDASITAVEQVRDAKKTQIEAAKNLTETQKEALKNQVDEIADKAIDNIKNATTDATVKDAETAGINEILNVTIPTLDAAKSDAKQAIADALTAKTAEINAAQNLTDAEKQKLIDQAQTEAAAANKNIDAATTNDAAELAAKNGVQAILDIQVPTVEETRDQAKKNVDNALNSKKEEINNSNLSPAAKEALINEAEQAAENARTAIDNATTASAISEAEAAGIAAIENIKVSNAPTESDNPSNNQTNTETPTESNSTSQNNNNATQAPVQGNNTQTDLTGSHGTNLTTGQQTEKAADTNSKETLPQTGNETERVLSIAGLAIASLLGLFGLSGLGKKRD
ncbi:DUF1542 domain-containing protein [Limosilactobacillus reuteri]|uniref:DUF1542 domain-containing protein n=1 Tax=Limosilactobacillus reuteri TaxID=1598 RepID=A0AAW9A071_LIMRT|nr:DUF1542 domain-containing protein [Limosilactobacillus reuteri]MDV8946691.1 DUF1542 domain-containing protein [Limosilactobacillus reuteri]